MTTFRAFDSELDEEYPEHTRYAMAYEPIWQSLRISCRSQWSVLESARVCCARLELYINRGHDDKVVRIWRVFNLLCAIPYNQVYSQGGIHAIEYSATDFLLAYTDKIRGMYHEVGIPTEWDWAISRRGFKTIYRINPAWASFIFHSLKQERMRRKVKPELYHYLLMCTAVMRESDSE